MRSASSMNRSLIYYMDLRDVILKMVNQLLYTRQNRGDFNLRRLCMSIMKGYDVREQYNGGKRVTVKKT